MSVAVAALTALAACDSVERGLRPRRGPSRGAAGRRPRDRAGDHLALLGRSGSGKTTLLHVLGGLLVPPPETSSWKGEPLSTLDAAARGRARAGGIAYVFQGANLFPNLTAWENVAFAARAASRLDADGHGPERLLALVGLRTKGDSLPAELSGGEAQRVALPGRLRSALSSCSATSPPAISTRVPGTACST